MGALCNIAAWQKTTLVDLVDDAEKQPGTKMDSVVLGLENGKTVAVIVIAADREIDAEIAVFRKTIEV